MATKFAKVKADLFKNIQINAGIICSGFVPATGVVDGILSATSGGIQFASNPTYTDFFEDVDNLPPNTMQGKRITAWDPALSGTMLEVNADNVKSRLGAATITTADSVKKITPKAQLDETDFDDIWFVGDFSDVNTGANAGFIAIHLMNALNNVGFQLQTGKDAKGQSTFEYHGHYDVTDDDQTPPFEIYVKENTTP